MAVRQDERHDIVETVGDRIEAGKDEIDARVVVLREQHATVDEQQLPVDLEAGHVPSDVAQTAERDDPQGDGVKRRRGS
jgi:hypothetical protein